MQLRKYQSKLIKRIQKKRKKNKHILVSAPTGAGKTVMFATLAQEDGRILIVVPRIALIKQVTDTLLALGTNPRDISVHHGSRRVNRKARIHIGMINTLFNRFKKHGRDYLGDLDTIIVDECFPPEVEILTPNGFVRFDALNGNEKVAQYKLDGSIEYVTPLRYVKKDYDGDMVTFKSGRNIDITMTANHDMLVQSTSTGKFEKRKAKDVTISSTWKIPVAGEVVGSDNKLTPKEKLIIMHQADGSMHNTCISSRESVLGYTTTVGANSTMFAFKKERKENDFLKLMEKGSFTYSKVKHNTDRHICRYIVTDLQFVIDKDLRTSFDISNMSSKKAKKIIEYMVKWDGSVISETTYYYSSTSEKNVDFYQQVAILAGYKTNISTQVDNRSDTFNDVYRLTIVKKVNSIGLQNVSKTTSTYTGKVYCVTVPSGNIVVRSNKKVCVTGNCHIGHRKGMFKVLEHHYWKTSTWLGFSATPMDNKGYLLVGYDHLIHKLQTIDLVEQGYLLPIKIYKEKAPDLSHVGMVGGEYNQKELGEEMEKGNLVGNAYDVWAKDFKDKKTMIFCVNIKHAEMVAEEFTKNGIKVVVSHSANTSATNDAAHKSFSKGYSQVLISINKLTAGFDEPSVEVLLALRPTKTKSLYLQACGRTLRIYNPLNTILSTLEGKLEYNR